ncbi:MAG: IclR family transcriptional regulator [Propionibacteriaceae bacterium]|nr:IclR family transcriptional regulator [Propionibacteriaceae bacterium]
MEQQGPKKVAAVLKAIELVQIIEHESEVGLGISELARRADLPKSTTYRLLHTLESTGALNSVEGRYRLGSLMSDSLSIPGGNEVDRIQRVVTPFLAALFERTRMTVQLAATLGGEIVFLNKLHGVQRVPSPSRIGGRAPVHCTSLGKALLAFDPRALDRVCAGELQRWTARTITDPDELRRHILRIRRTRIARDDGEYLDTVGSVASIVVGQGGEPVASLAVTGPRADIRAGRFDPIVLDVCARASAAYRRALQHTDRP